MNAPTEGTRRPGKSTHSECLCNAGKFREKCGSVRQGGADHGRERSSSPKQFGLLGSSFFFMFSIMAILVGFRLNRSSRRAGFLMVLAAIWEAQLRWIGTVSSPSRACR